jgi:hypothetical protein
MRKQPLELPAKSDQNRPDDSLSAINVPTTKAAA